MKRFPSLILIAVVTALVMTGCRGHQPSTADAKGAAGGGSKAYPMRGKIVAVNAAKGEVTVDHEAIPGYMDAMSMPYKLKDKTIVSELHPGDRMTADLIVPDSDESGSVLDHIVITAQAKPDYKPATFFHVPAEGDEVPNFALRNQSDRVIRLDQFRGKALLVTFVYTRCRLADFCPRMSQNFAKLDKALAADPALYAKTHLLSVSFDPEYDTPKVLRSYGGAYTGNYTNEKFEHWDFAVPGKADLPEVAKFFDLGVTPEEDKTITHSLSTTLIGPDGKVYRFYPGNDWSPDDVLNDVKHLLKSGA